MAEGLRDALVSRNSETTVQNISFENAFFVESDEF